VGEGLSSLCKKTLTEESLDFLDAVEKFDSQPSRALAQQMCSKFVASSLINLPAPMQNALTRWFAPDTSGWRLPRGRDCRVTIRSGLPGGRGPVGKRA
jgi:hypothetical protein